MHFDCVDESAVLVCTTDNVDDPAVLVIPTSRLFVDVLNSCFVIALFGG